MAAPSSSHEAIPKAGLQPSRSSSISRRDIAMANNLQNTTSLTFRELQEITDNFSEQRAVGEGSFGKVYKAVRANGEEMAVKLLYNNRPEADDGQFRREFENLMMLEHRNVVRLVGYCYETQHKLMHHMGKTIYADEIFKALCFEYMQNGSLQKHISEECDGLNWHTHYKIIKGTCEGLEYLHEGLEEPIYHLDLKPDNILLDENMVPKLADFGLSKLFGEQETMVTKIFAGTLGYLPPEYLFHQVISKKLDIFSLGVVMIKIIAGHSGHTRKAEMSHQDLLDQVHQNWRNRLQETWHDSPHLEAHCQQVKICTEIALNCMETDRHKRPNIVDIIHKLNETETRIREMKSNHGHKWASGEVKMNGNYSPKSQRTMGMASPDIDDSSRRHDIMSSKLIKNEHREPAILTLRVLQDATLGFAKHRVLGEGPHGKVYLGLHDNGEKIAIKLFHRTMRELDDIYFHNEFHILTMVDHRNIIKLVGYCYETVREIAEFEGSITERTQKALCFEYMHNGSLEEHLSNECSGFDWDTRYKIIKGTCNGLKYLHEELEESIYHLDLTPSNILLDENMMPKLSGFGCSKLFGHKQTRVPQSRIVTVAYLPPEYLFGNVVSKKLDIFTLGVVMIKIIAGPRGLSRSAEMPYQEFLDQVNENWRYRFEEERNYAGSVEACCKQVNKCTEIALSCKNNDRDERPSIVDIIQKLNETETVIDMATQQNEQ